MGFCPLRTSDATHDMIGVADVAFLNGQLYAVTGGGGCSDGNLDIPDESIRLHREADSTPIANLRSEFFRLIRLCMKTHASSNRMASSTT